MGVLFFCNIGWMNRYEGLTGKPDNIVGGGKYVDENNTGHEVCNFKVADDGYVYGHVETIKKDIDRSIRLESFGGKGESAFGIDVIWTATNREEGGRRIVGWYRDATIFRKRQEFSRPPSKQHARDKVDSYRIRALAENCHRLDLDDRQLAMGFGPGWMGHTPWWTPSRKPSEEISKFLEKVRYLIDGLPVTKKGLSQSEQDVLKSPSTAADPYVRYIQANEVEVVPRHYELQEHFKQYLQSCGASEIQSNVASVDLRFRNPERGLVLVEIKPCKLTDARYAIRTAMGQLLDYRQRTPENSNLLIVIEVKPHSNDQELAISNGFGIAYPSEREFKIFWP